ncbi:hypothetical protein C8N40_109144 [Pontibacter mucosus]|uniref:Uncharacterized protein n=1 Tax=Pontibacter mucosus TaxID=1649266 RepID=A0A2T5YEA6_9BACT|nr:hypothetical protein [Pontibacter mucosus]PTX15046.1 hypothetical protein C8N40_109144 [Pontibacter mucosus]
MNENNVITISRRINQDSVLTLIVLASIGIVIGISKYSLNTVFFGSKIDSTFLQLFASFDGIIGFFIPFLIAAFFCINGYLCLIFVEGKGSIQPLFSKFWIGFLPLLLTSFITAWALLDLTYYDIEEIMRLQEKGSFEVLSLLTLNDLKYLNYLAILLLYGYVAFTFRYNYKLSILKSVACTLIPTLLMYIFSFLF